MKEKCQRTDERLAPYVDELLPADERSEVDQHLGKCPPCRESAVKEQGGKTLLRERAAELRAAPLPPGLRTRCAAIAHQHCQASGAGPWRSRLIPLTLGALTALATAAVVFSVATARSNTLLAAQLTADHSKCFFVSPPSAAGIDAGVAERILSAEYGWQVHVPATSPANGVRLLDARRCFYGDGRVPHLLYDVDGHQVSLFMLPGKQREAADITQFGVRSRIWSRGGNTFVLVSAAAAGDLTRAVAYVQQEAR